MAHRKEGSYLAEEVGNCFVFLCPTVSKDLIDKPNEKSILKVHLMSIWKGLKGKEGGKHEKDYVDFSGYGFDPNRLWCLLQFWICVSVF